MDQKIILERAQQMLKAEPSQADRWLTAWKELSIWSSQVPSKNYGPSLKLLSQADLCFEQDDWAAFERIYQQFQNLIDQH